jgi:hypothetical protein
MNTKDKLKVTIRGDKEITAWHLEVAFELEGEEYDAMMYYNDFTGFSFDAYSNQQKLHNQLKELDIEVWDLCTEILDAEVSE